MRLADGAGQVHEIDPPVATEGVQALDHVAQLPLFADGFGKPGPDADWQALTGNWTASAGGAFLPDPARVNLALVAAGALPAVGAGRVDAAVTLPAGGGNAAIVFAAQDRGRYRYVRLEPGRVRIGQVGDFGGAVGGVRASVAAAVPAGAPVRVRCAVHASGLVRVFLGGATVPAASFRFPQAVPGRVGLAARLSAASFDSFASWDHHAIP